MGFTYNVKERRSYATYWQCTKRPSGNPCKASVTEKPIGVFTPGMTSHNHVCDSGSLVATNIVKTVKAKVMEDKFKSAQVIVEEVLLDQMTDGPCSTLPKTVNIARAANRLRQRMRPKDPQDCDFDLQTDAIPEGFLRADVSEGPPPFGVRYGQTTSNPG
ncbi:hypothetical protein QZH41_010995 [Actinostola sp. cb2023]|nr:hypothetical protein QZH41_010995 [Actinostola sp. cb2023]